MKRIVWAAAIAAALSAPFIQPAAAAESAAEFYKGKTVFMQVGAGPEGSYNLLARLIARHMGRHIPGNPTIVVQNVPGGGSLALANQFGNSTPRDGTYFGLFNNGMPTIPLLDPHAGRFDPRKFHFLGSPQREAHLFGVGGKSQIKTMDDVFNKTTIVAGEAPGAAPTDFPRLTNALIGTKFKIISGYQHQGDRTLAMQRGEVDGQAGSSWTTVRSMYKDMLANNEYRVIAAFGMKQNRDLMNVPMFPVGKTTEERQLFQLMYARQSYGRPLATPPDVPPERVQALKAALEATFKDPEYLAEAEKLDLETDPVPADELTALTIEIYNTPQAVLDRMPKALAEGAEKIK